MWVAFYSSYLIAVGMQQAPEHRNRKTGMNTAQIWSAPEPTWAAIAHLTLENYIHFDFLWFLFPFYFSLRLGVVFYFISLKLFADYPLPFRSITVLSGTPLKDLFSPLEFQMPYKQWLWVRVSSSIMIELVFMEISNLLKIHSNLHICNIGSNNLECTRSITYASFLICEYIFYFYQIGDFSLHK